MQKRDVTEHDMRQVFVDVPSLPFFLVGVGTATRRLDFGQLVCVILHGLQGFQVKKIKDKSTEANNGNDILYR